MGKLRPDWAPDKLSDAVQYLMRCGIEQQGWKQSVALFNLAKLLEDAHAFPAGPSAAYVNLCMDTFSPQYDQRKQSNILANQAAQLSWSKGAYAAAAVAKAQDLQAPTDAARSLILSVSPVKGQATLEAFIAVLTATTGCTDAQALASLNDVAFGVRGAVCRDKVINAINKVAK